MFATIDVGSNTVRMLLGDVAAGQVVPRSYERKITRLAGGFTEEKGLAPESMERTLSALQTFAKACRRYAPERLFAVGTAAFRRAINGAAFARQVRETTGIDLKVITGSLEAQLTARGVLSALDSIPENSLVVDIGGGSTEFVLCLNEQVVWEVSRPLGVVRLIEEIPAADARQAVIRAAVVAVMQDVAERCRQHNVALNRLTLVGTAGTVTTLAALDMAMVEYDWRRVNNYRMTKEKLMEWSQRLATISVAERELLPGMETGRGDLIVPGVELLLALLEGCKVDDLVVSDFGILEGAMLALSADEIPTLRD